MSSMTAASIHLVVPCFRETGRIGAFLPDLCARMDALGEVDVLVVDDGSGQDEQSTMTELIEQWRGQFRCLQRPLLLPENIGKGGAVYAGWERHQGQAWLGFVDADGACPAAEVERLIGMARAQQPLQAALFASRVRMLGRDFQRQFSRHVLGRIYADLVAELLHIPVHDSQCGLKLVPRAAYEAVKPLLSIQGFAFDVELLAALWDSRHEVVEVPIDWHEVPGGKIRLMRDSLRMLGDVLAIRRRRRSSQWQNTIRAIQPPPR